MEAMPYYAIFSLLALVIKVWICWFNRNAVKRANRWFWAFFSGLMIINLLEFIGFIYPAKGNHALELMTLYYIGLIIMSGSLLGLTLEMARLQTKTTAAILYCVLLGGVTSLSVPGMVIAGVESIGYANTRIPGPFYWVFQVLFVGALLGSIGLLFYALAKPVDLVAKRKAKALLLATTPLIAAGITIVILMQLGIRITGSVVGSFATLIFLLVLVLSENEHKLFELLTYIPKTSEHSLAVRVRRMLSGMGSADLNKAIAEFEQLVIMDALQKCKGNKSNAASMLGISRSTLRRKLQAD